ncbi:MAG: hypothetical protein K2X48_19280 [Chitinophagaceae bacterium]|nr:hypothetical protein [Chitinophagaceae bacterium]
MKIFCIVIVLTLAFSTADAQADSCLCRVFEKYEDYLQGNSICYDKINFKSFFNNGRRLKYVKNGVAGKLIKENFWGAQLNVVQKDSTPVQQLFRLDFYSSETYAVQEITDNYVVYFALSPASGKLVKFVSLSLKPVWSLDRNIQVFRKEEMRILFGRKTNWRAKFEEIRLIKPSVQTIRALNIKRLK